MRNLVIVLGDQLNRDSAALRDLDPRQDRVWMAEVRHESSHVPSHKARSVLFLSAMRHFRATLTESGWPVTYRALGEHDHERLGPALAETIREVARAYATTRKAGIYYTLGITEHTCGTDNVYALSNLE